jgi:hypothetical protein
MDTTKVSSIRAVDPADHLERIYAGVLGKIIGVYAGRPFESWTYQRIMNQLGPIHYYVHDRLGMPLVVPDDDIAGPFTFIRAIDEHQGAGDLTSEKIGKTWLNNVIEEQSIFWWAGRGISTEHTAYLNLKMGMAAPLSGAIATNGKTVAEQVGGQIFIDGWAMLSPGNPSQAAKLAEAAARVSHDGEAVYAATLWAAMEAEAFISKDINHLLDLGLSFIPSDCAIACLITDIRMWVPQDCDWHKTRKRIEDNYGYHNYQGVCHIIPNHGLMIMALLYAGNNFHEAMHIINTSGWDTDSNGGNLGCLVAIINGLSAFDGGPNWRGPVADRVLISTADGGYAINNAASLALDVANLGRKLRGMEPILPPKEGAQFHFTLPGSVQGFRPYPSITARVEQGTDPRGVPGLAIRLFDHGPTCGSVEVLTDTHHPVDLPIEGQLYYLSASPLIYPGQTIQVKLFAEDELESWVQCRLVIKSYDSNDRSSKTVGPSQELSPGSATTLEWTIPESASYEPIHAVGIELSSSKSVHGAVWLDYLRWKGNPAMTLRLPPGDPQRQYEFWKRAWVTSVDRFHTWDQTSFLIAKNYGEGLTTIGTREWTNYSVAVTGFKVHIGGPVGVIVRAQGLNRWYGLLLTESGTRLCIVKARDEKRSIIASSDFHWGVDIEYSFSCSVVGPCIRVEVDGTVLEAKDLEEAYDSGGTGLLVTNGSLSVEQIKVRPLC